MSQRKFSRRKILRATGGGLGAFALLGGAHTAMATEQVDYNQQTIVEGTDVDIRVAWKETYNGAVVERQDSPTDRPDSNPVVTQGNLMPGDSGRVAFGVVLNEGTSNVDSAEVELRIVPGPEGFTENGITEPERKAGDTTPLVGELQNAVDVTVWRDAGMLETLPYGACDGEESFGEGILAEGTLAEVTNPEGLGSWTVLTDDNGCLGPDEFLCVGLSWSVDSSVGNIIQGDGAQFDIEFGANSCAQ